MATQQTKFTRRRVLEYLLFEDMTTIQLSKLLGIREFAMRRHLELMEKEGLVTYNFKQIGMGRPKKMYSLTEKARDTFPKRYSLLSNLMIENMIKQSGKEYARNVLVGVSEEIAKYYVSQAKDLEGRLKEFTRFLTEFGCFASYSKENDIYLLFKRNCVFSDVAKQYEDIMCEVDAQATIKALGNVTLIREMCLGKGDRMCKYVIIPLETEEKGQ